MREFNYAPLPAPMQAETLQVIQKIVAPGDTGEEVIDFRGSLIAGYIKFIAHGMESSGQDAVGQT